MYNLKFAEEIGYVDVINSQSVNAASINSIGVNAGNFERFAYIVTPTNVGAAGTIDGRLQCSITSNFAVAVNLAGTNLAQMTANNVAQLTEVRADQIANALATTNASNTYVRLQLTGGGNAVTVTAVGLGKDAAQRPAGSNYNLNTSYFSGSQASTV